jgi:arsenite-transporting ATPase
MNRLRYVFFSGKGGAGKTTMACATAYHYAQAGERTLIITTDPASNLADLVDAEIGHTITSLSAPNLYAVAIDPDRATEEYIERVLSPMRSVIPPEALRVLEDQFRSPCTAEIASFDRFVDFISGDVASRHGEQFEKIVFDTAPTGHTLRLLDLPVDWSQYIEEHARGRWKTDLGPLAAIRENKAKYDEARRLLANWRITRFFFVLQPEGASLWETRRSAQELAHLGIRRMELIVNGILPEQVCTDPFFRHRFEIQQKYLRRIDSLFALPKRLVFLRDWEIRGAIGLKNFAEELFLRSEGRQGQPMLRYGGANERQSPRLIADPVLPLLQPDRATKAVFFAGEGGVGKTVVSCATAYFLASQGYKTLLMTTDPAARIGEVLERTVGEAIQPIAGIPNLYAIRIDRKRAVEDYKRRIFDEARENYDDDLLLALEEELESPCTEAIAAFEELLAYADSDEYDAIVFDTAPAGHALRRVELAFEDKKQLELRVEAPALSAEVKKETQKHRERVFARLRDPQRTVLAFVMRPEPTSIVEAHRAFLDLRKAGMAAQFVVATQVLEPGTCTNDFFRSRRQMQEGYLRDIRERFQVPVANLPLFETEIAGLELVERAGQILYGSEAHKSGTTDKAVVGA